MNKRQKIVIIIGTVLVVLQAFFPVMMQTGTCGGLSAVKLSGSTCHTVVDLLATSLRIFGLLILTGAGYLLTKSKTK